MVNEVFTLFIAFGITLFRSSIKNSIFDNIILLNFIHVKYSSVLFILTLVTHVHMSVKVLFRGNLVFICVSHLLISYISILFVYILVVFSSD